MNNSFCSLCSRPLKAKLFAAPDGNDNNKLYSFYQCAGCTLVQIRPFPNKKKIDKYYSYVDADNHAKIKNQQINFLYNLPLGKIMLKKYIDLCYQQRYQLIIKLHTKGRILDIGCGEGSFLKKFTPEKWQRVGIEINKNLARSASLKLKNTIISTKPLESASLPINKLEIITMWHVLEHINNPTLVLESIKKLINPNGYLVIEVPHGNSLYRKIFRENWQMLLLPQHLFFWTGKSIPRILKETGFQTVRVSYPGIISFSGSSSLANFLRSKKVNTYIATLIAILFFPLVLIINILSLKTRDNMLIIAKLKT